MVQVDGSPEPRRPATADEARRPAQDALRAIIERLADGVIVVDMGGHIRFANPAAEQLFGRTAEELAGTPFGFAVVSGAATEIEVVRRGGEVVTAELRVVQLDWDGAPAFLVSLRDVTDRKAAEERARQLEEERSARAKAEAASQAKSEFLAMMSHELRTPLNAVLGYADLLSLGLAGPLTDAQRQQIGRITASGRHLLNLVNEILDLTRVEAGRLTVAHEPVAAAPLADAALVLVQPQAEGRALTLSSRVDREVSLAAVGDEHRIRQILVNVLSNAVKFTPAGGTVTLAVEAAATADSEAKVHGSQGWVAFRVEDTGVGIPADRIDALFAPFVQAERGHTRPQDGSGLGLAISRRLARLMGGDLTVRSTPGRGSTFTLWLPAAPEPGAAPEAAVVLSGRDPKVRGLGDIGDALLRELERVLDCFIERLRTEGVTPAASELRFSQLADHVSTLIADVAGTLTVLEDSEGQPSQLLEDGADIRRMIAERHGQQRARLGFTEEAMRREYAVLRDEMHRAIDRCFSHHDQESVAEASTVVARLLDQAERSSVQALLQAGAEK
jgi:signal transduction histidine kinase